MSKSDRKELVLPGKSPNLFCDAVQYGDMIFTSGIVARNPDSSVFAPGDAAAQTRYIFGKIAEILALGDSSFQDIIRMNIYVRNMEDRLKINPLREEYFQGVRPASTVVEVSKLAHPDLVVEVEVVAIAGSMLDGIRGSIKDGIKNTVSKVNAAKEEIFGEETKGLVQAEVMKQEVAQQKAEAKAAKQAARAAKKAVTADKKTAKEAAAVAKKSAKGAAAQAEVASEESKSKSTKIRLPKLPLGKEKKRNQEKSEVAGELKGERPASVLDEAGSKEL